MALQIKVILILFALFIGSIAVNILQMTKYTKLSEVTVEEIYGKESEIKVARDSLSTMTVHFEFWKAKWDSLSNNPKIKWRTVKDTIWLSDTVYVDDDIQLAKILTDTIGVEDSLKVYHEIVFEDTGDTLKFWTAQIMIVDVWMAEDFRFFMDGELYQRIVDPVLIKLPKKIDMKDRLQILLNGGANGGVDRFDPIGGVQVIFNERWSVSGMSNFKKGKYGYHGIYGGYKIFGM